MCLSIVCESKFIIGESRTIFHANDTQAQQVAPNPRRGRFYTETPLERERRPQIQREQRRGGHGGLRYCGIGLFFMRYFGNFNFNVRYCGII